MPPAMRTILLVPGEAGTTKLRPVPSDGAVSEPKVSVFVPAVGVSCTVPAPAEILRIPIVSVLPVLKAL